MHPSSSSSSSSSSSHAVIHHPGPNWLAFSLSNNNNNDNNNNNAAPAPFSLFHPFNPTTEEETPTPHPPSSSPAHLSILSGSGPELSDFLCVVPLSATPRFTPPPPPADEIYDASDLKTITASFLRGFSSDVSQDHEYQPQHQQELQLLASDGHNQQQQAGKKAVDTFGQRTSIYRGVTRYDVSCE